MRMPILVSALALLAGWSCKGDCDTDLITVESGSHLRTGDNGQPDRGLQHPGTVERMDVDREAGIVRLHGVTDSGEAFVETWRIRAER